MGQGYSTSLPLGPSAVEVAELSDLTFEKPLGGARFLRTVRARHQHGLVVVKVCAKANSSITFKTYGQALRQQRSALAGIPNVLPYARIRETRTVGLLVRQYVHSSLYDRISIRPFLENIEKKWIAFQLLCALRDCHAREIFHGDIKTENVLVTSWCWVYLVDFAATFKPVYLPEDNPADFSYYYDTSNRRTCYLAPERFLAAGQAPHESHKVQWNMDIFSMGCVLAELFTETPTFTLSQLFRYRRGEYDPTVSLLNKVDDVHMRSLISSMIRLDPGERWHASDYLDEYKSKAFPLYFYQHLHVLMQELTDPTSGRKQTLNKVYDDFEMLAVSLNYGDILSPTPQHPVRPARTLFPLQVDLPNNRHAANSMLAATGDNGTFILLNVVTASLRSAGRAYSKIRACELLLAFAERLPDEAKMDRILPYIMPLLDDSESMVLVAALRSLTQLLALVTVVSPVNSFLFTQYIFPRLQAFVKTNGFKNNSIVRETYAACLASLAETASRFLDMMQALRAEGSLPSSDKAEGDGYAAYHDAYDATRLEVLDAFEGQTKVFLTDTDTAVRRAFLTAVPSLCVFFGEVRASDIILSHLNTYLNDPDWLLKCAFFRAIVGVAVYIGGASLEDFILPLMLQALADPQDFVVERALRSLASMAEFGLLQRPKTWELIDTIARFQLHPNVWIKEAAAHFVFAATTYLSIADGRTLVTPLIQPYLKVPVSILSESDLLDALKKPIPRTVLDMAMEWAKRTDRGIFWKTAREGKQLSYRAIAQMPPTSSVSEFGAKALGKVPKNDEDEQWLVAPDHMFFLTGSDDGTVKVWDAGRLERNVTHRTRQTYRLAPGVKVTSLCFVDSTHTFVCTGSDGSVHVVKVEVTEQQGSTRYAKLRNLRDWQIPTDSQSGEHAVWADHYRGDSTSTLVLATNIGRILAVDLRYMVVEFDLHNLPEHGMPTCFCIGRKRDWLLVGTTHGVLSLWDLRFRLRLRSWTFSSATPITRLQLHPSRKSAKRNRVCVSGGTTGGEVTVWDVEKVICHEVYRPAHAHSKDRLHLRDYELRNLDEERSDGLLSRVAGAVATDANTSESDTSGPAVITAIHFGLHQAPEDAEALHAFALTGGPDGKLRFWDCDRLEGCRVVSGGSPGEKSSYSFSQLGLDTRVLTEKLLGDDDSSAPANAVESSKTASNNPAKRPSSSRTGVKPSRYETIRLSAQRLLDGHLDTITDVALLERPYGMAKSGNDPNFASRAQSAGAKNDNAGSAGTGSGGGGTTGGQSGGGRGGGSTGSGGGKK
ncbi:Serine/threonine-protein kinase [Friedmanniomyces endolithicus]|nr:Serine/threonine-protein kinase [Friedmanniomyces endolithicus]